jgi:hypothetical protein
MRPVYAAIAAGLIGYTSGGVMVANAAEIPRQCRGQWCASKASWLYRCREPAEEATRPQ